MIKEPMENIVGLKALAWDRSGNIFTSPARPAFIWSPGGLQMSDCPNCGHTPKEDCSCGLYATYNYKIALEYTSSSFISPIFLVEASGITHLYSDGFRCQEMTIHAVAPNTDSKASEYSASQAADYFGVQVVYSLEVLTLMQDFHDFLKYPEIYDHCRSTILKGKSYDEVLEISKSYKKEK